MVSHCLDMQSGAVLHWPFPGEAWARPPFTRGKLHRERDKSGYENELDAIFTTAGVTDNRLAINLLQTTWRVMHLNWKQENDRDLTDADGRFFRWMYED